MADIVEQMRAYADEFPIKDTGAWIDFASLYLVKGADEIERLRAALEGLLRCPAIADGNHNEPAWACPETIEAERIARRALGGDNG